MDIGIHGEQYEIQPPISSYDKVNIDLQACYAIFAWIFQNSEGMEIPEREEFFTRLEGENFGLVAATYKEYIEWLCQKVFCNAYYPIFTFDNDPDATDLIFACIDFIIILKNEFPEIRLSTDRVPESVALGDARDRGDKRRPGEKYLNAVRAGVTSSPFVRLYTPVFRPISFTISEELKQAGEYLYKLLMLTASTDEQFRDYLNAYITLLIENRSYLN